MTSFVFLLNSFCLKLRILPEVNPIGQIVHHWRGVNKIPLMIANTVAVSIKISTAKPSASIPRGTTSISITAKPKKKPKPEAPAPDPKDEEPAEVFKTDEPEEKPFPVYHSVYEEDRQEGEERYKQKLRDMCLRIFSSGIPGVHTMEKIYADIGYALVKELAQGGETDEAL